jgi:hypothetical protein
VSESLVPRALHHRVVGHRTSGLVDTPCFITNIKIMTSTAYVRDLACDRALRNRSFDKWSLIASARGTSNVLQHPFVDHQLFMRSLRVHPRLLEAAYDPVRRSSRLTPDWLASQRSQRTSLYSSWERGTHGCSERDQVQHVERCCSVRDALRHHHLVEAELDRFWVVVEPMLPPPKFSTQGAVMLFEQFLDVQRRLSKALLQRKYDLSDAEIHRAARSDWDLDRRADEEEHGVSFMCRSTFLDAIFHVADAWAPGTSPVEYAAFLRILFNAIAEDADELLPLDEVRPISTSDEDYRDVLRGLVALDTLPCRPRSLYGRGTGSSKARAAALASEKQARQAERAEEGGARGIEKWRAARLSAANNDTSNTPHRPLPSPDLKGPVDRLASPGRSRRATASLKVSGQVPVSHLQSQHPPTDAGAWLERAEAWVASREAPRNLSPRDSQGALQEGPALPSLSVPARFAGRRRRLHLATSIDSHASPLRSGHAPCMT